MKVRNLNGASGMRGAEAGWLSYGAFVPRDFRGDMRWYAPLGGDCSWQTDRDPGIWDLAKLVSVLDAKVPLPMFHRRAVPQGRIEGKPPLA